MIYGEPSEELKSYRRCISGLDVFCQFETKVPDLDAVCTLVQYSCPCFPKEEVASPICPQLDRTHQARVTIDNPFAHLRHPCDRYGSIRESLNTK